MSVDTLCIKHNRDLSIYDLTCQQLICERCALFQDRYRGHNFIESNYLGAFASDIYFKFTAEFQQLGLSSYYSTIDWTFLKSLSQKTQSQHTAKINNLFDAKIKQLEQQRKLKLFSLQQDVSKLISQCKQTICSLLSARLTQLSETKAKLEVYAEQKKYQQICKLMNDNKPKDNMCYIQKQLEMLKLLFQQKFNELDSDTFPALLPKTSYRQDDLLAFESELIVPLGLTLDQKHQSSSRCISKCPTERSHNVFSSQELPLRTLQNTKVQLMCQNVKKVNSKTQIKNIVIKNNVRQLNLIQLNLNDREAIEAVKICTSNNFVTKLDLTANDLTHRFLIQLKRDKPKSRYLKTIIVRGIKLTDCRLLKKQGIQLSENKQTGKLHLGELIIQY